MGLAPESAQAIMLFLLSVICGGIINGLITYGVIKTTLSFHTEGIREAKNSALRAHTRLDNHLTVHHGIKS